MYRLPAQLVGRVLTIIVIGSSVTACAAPNAPQPTVTLPATAAAVIPTTDAQAASPVVGPTRTALPSLTPSVAAGGAANTVPTSAVVAPTVAAANPTTAPSGNTTGAVGPTSTSALLAVTVQPSSTPLPPAAITSGSAPALDVKLPDGWKAEYYVVPIREALVQASVNLARYYGPVKGNGVGTILVLWGFPSIGAPPTIAAPGPTATFAPNVTPLSYIQQLLWSDGLRLLQGTVVEITCNVGTYEQRFFHIGNETGIGAYFNVTQCPNEPETVGWFAGVNVGSANYLFYAYIEPIQSYNEGRADLQNILNTVTFKALPISTNTPKP
jgi:hypothetical protein